VKNPIQASTLALLALLLAPLPGCTPLVLGGAVIGGSMVASDRRTSGAQVEDESIELKGNSRIDDLATLGHVSVTSYNRMVLLTGEVPTDADRARVEDAIRRLENVRSVVNELAVMGNTSLTQRSSDSIVSGKVKATFVDAKDLQANSIKVVTDRGIVYLMGRLTEREAGRAAELTRSVSGVQKVILVFEIVSEQELANLQPKPAPASAPSH
jgi:osmotically-inducible protein OsmY